VLSLKHAADAQKLRKEPSAHEKNIARSHRTV
jgi:hypothetical protein